MADSWTRRNQSGHVGRGERCRKVSGFSTVLGPLIMISQRQAAPSRYQHIISGLVQPLNHTRHRNPLVSVTFSPTQEARSQSAIWMLWPLSFHFPPRFIYFFPFFFLLPSHKTSIQTPPSHYLFCICCILCISICVSPAISLYITSPFYQLHPPKKHISSTCTRQENV